MAKIGSGSKGNLAPRKCHTSEQEIAWKILVLAMCAFRHLYFYDLSCVVTVIGKHSLIFTRGICELCLRSRSRPRIKLLPDTHPQSPPSPAGSTSGPPVK